MKIARFGDQVGVVLYFCYFGSRWSHSMELLSPEHHFTVRVRRLGICHRRLAHKRRKKILEPCSRPPQSALLSFVVGSRGLSKRFRAGTHEKREA